MKNSTADISPLLQQYFDKVLVLTVPSFKVRQKRINKRLAGISFDFFYGVDKNELTAQFIRDNYVYDKKTSLSVKQVFKELNKGELACALSHRNLYKYIVENGWKKVLVLEDDIIPDPDNLSYLGETLQELPPNWGLFYLGYQKHENVTLGLRLKLFWYKVMCMLGLSRLPLKMVNNILPKKFSRHLMKAGFHDCTHAYALTLETAKQMIDAQTQVKYRSDNLLTSQVLNEKVIAFVSKFQFFRQQINFDRSEISYVRKTEKLYAE
jgi:glycosyl transferase family 25